MNTKQKLQLKFAGVVVLAVVSGLIAYPQAIKKITPLYNGLNKLKVNLGLDLQGGVHLEYKADVSKLDSARISDAMQSAQDVIERRVNAFGVGEPLVYSTQSRDEHRIVVELPGIKDVEQAKSRIGEAPNLEFREQGIDPQLQQILEQMDSQAKQKAQDLLKQAKEGANFEDLAKNNSQDPGSKDKGGDLGFFKKGTMVPEFDKVVFDSGLKPGEIYPDLVETQYGWHIIKLIETRGEGDNLEAHAEHILIANAANTYGQQDMFKYKSTGLTGKNVKNVQVVFQQQGVSAPEISLVFDDEGAKLFADITKRNVGKPLAIFLDGQLRTAPVIQTEITNGQAVITGNFTVDEANKLQRTINEGALPVPLSLVSQSSVEASLGMDSLKKIVISGAIGLGAVILFMLVFYRFLGLVASLALLIYTALMVTIFKLTGITLTLSGIAGFVLSIGMAVDANILIFERTKEEIRNGRTIANALDEGFKRAWTSIRDGNFSSLLTAGILYLMGTGFVKGFAASLFIGVVVSMFTAVVITRTMLKFIISDWIHGRVWMVGVRKSDIKE
ncbi:MAG TPA: protein translocase subunit SecD [Patescibacteria group bacterium]